MPYLCIKPSCDSMGCVMCNCAVPMTEKLTPENAVQHLKRAATTAERQRAYKSRQRALGLTEVRGIYVPTELHAMVKNYAKALKEVRAKEKKA